MENQRPWPNRPIGQFFRFTTCPTEVMRLPGRQRPAVVVVEACLLSSWVHDLCPQHGVKCFLANSAGEAWKLKHTKRKTNQDDGLCLASLCALGQLPTGTVPSLATREWQALIAYRQTLVGRCVAVQNPLRALLVGQGLTTPVDARVRTAADAPRSWSAGPLGKKILDGVPRLVRKQMPGDPCSSINLPRQYGRPQFIPPELTCPLALS